MSAASNTFLSEGIDMHRDHVALRPVALSGLERFCLNYFSTAVVVALAVSFYTVFGTYHIKLFSARWRPELFGYVAHQVWHFRDVLLLVAGVYMIMLLPYYWFNPTAESKASIVCRWLVCRLVRCSPCVDTGVRQAALSILLKFIFIPFCINGLWGHFAVLNNQIVAAVNSAGSALDARELYSSIWHNLIMNLILVFDFVPFVIGYMVELPSLKNRIRSVDGTLLGWVVCLACYPPFNEGVGRFLSWATRDFVVGFMLPSPVLFYAVNGSLLVLFALYASASVSLGFKCCNLCNRGVVATGLYGVVRHPAYVIKNLAWWVAAVPVLVVLFRQSFALGLYGAFSLACWTSIYAARAITEERHLLRSGNEYAVYMARVRWRFIPGLI
jgi:protein-S-isoprenylcysteine O-methyltransferase Ste14